MQLCWRTSPRGWTAAERDHAAQWDDDTSDYVRVQQQGAWLSSGMLRRAALLHTVANTLFADGYRSVGNAVRLVLRTSHVRSHGPGPHHIVQALADPVCGLPLKLTRFRGDTDADVAQDQQFVLKDPGKTAVLDLRATVERPMSFIQPDLWQSILRRLPRTGFPTVASVV
ncbi:hypothetical protein [Streptomyces sp. NPDC002851]